MIDWTIDSFGKIDKKMKKYFLFSLLLSLFIMLPEIILSYDMHHLLVMLFTTILLWASSGFSKWLFAILFIYLNIVNIVIMHVAIHWGYAYSDLSPRIAVMLESPASETLEYFKSYIDYRDLFILVYAIIMFYFIYKFIVICKIKFKKIKVVSILFLTLSLIIFYKYIRAREPYVLVYKIYSAMKKNPYIESRHKYIATLPQNINLNKKILYDKIILVLGESANKHHMGLYGYNRPTTPFLTKLSAKNNSYVFNVISPANLTRLSVPIYMTGLDVSEFYQSFVHSSSLMLDLNRVGHASLWLSAQSKVGGHNNWIAECSNDANMSIFINNFYSSWGKKDIEIINTLKNDKNLTFKYKMILLHLTGSHEGYKNRYEKKHSLLEPKNIIDEYDNTIYYTDYVLENIFKLFVKPNKKVLFLYISDHGEIVDMKKNGHGFLPPSKDEYDIPFFVYSSIKNSRLDDLANKNKKHYFNMKSFHDIFEYIIGYSDDINISYSSKVIATDPQYIFDYEKINYYK